MLLTRFRFSLAIAIVGGVGTAAQDPKRDKTTHEYAGIIAQAQQDLEKGDPSAARHKLEATDKSLRSFEYQYLLARAKAATEKGPTPDLVRTIERPEAESRYGVLNEIDRRLVYICRDGGLSVHDLTNPKAPPKPLEYGKGGAIWSGAFSYDGKAFVTGHQNGDVLVWDAKTWKVRHTIPLGEVVRELAVAPDGSAFVAEGKTELELWSLDGNTPKKIAGVGERYNFGEGLAFSPNGDQLATGGMFDIVVYNAKTGEKTKTMRHASYTMGLEYSPDGKRIASAPRGNVNRFLGVFDVAGAKPLFNAGPFGNYVAGLAFTPDGKRIAATGCEKMLRVFDSTTGEVVLTLPRPECGAKPAISRDGRLLGWSEPGGYRYIDLGKKADESK
jgi:WD40 repeat protein